MPDHIAILRESGAIGDCVCTFPTAAAFRRARPDATIVQFGPPDLEALVGMNPAVNLFVPVSYPERRASGAKSDPKRFPYLDRGPVPFADYAAVADLWGCEIHGEKMMLRRPQHDWPSRVEIFLGAAGLLAGITDRAQLCPRAEIPAAATAAASAWFDGRVGQASCLPRFVGLQPFASSARRTWPKARWIELASNLISRGFKVLIFDGQAKRIDGIAGTPAVGLPLPQVAALVAHCELMITPDSGLFHLAGSVGVPALGIFGPTHGQTTARPYPLAQVIQLQPTEFSPPRGCLWPCYGHGNRGQENCENRSCRALDALTTEAVLARALAILKPALPAESISVPSTGPTRLTGPTGPTSSPRSYGAVILGNVGMGDHVTVMPTAREIRRRLGGVVAFVPQWARPLWELCPDVDSICILSGGAEHGHMRRFGQHDSKRWPCFDAGPVPISQMAIIDDAWPAVNIGERNQFKRPLLEYRSRITFFLQHAGLYEELPREEAIRRRKPSLVITDDAAMQAEEWIRRNWLPGPPWVAFQPFANEGTRSLTHDAAKEICAGLKRAGLPVLIFDRADSRTDGLDGYLARGGSIPLTAALLSRCSLLVGVDSSMFHFAAALDIPALGLFGMTCGSALSEYYPLARTIQRAAGEFVAPRGCIYPCLGYRERGRRTCGGYHGHPCPALDAISPQEVVATALEMLGRDPHSSDDEFKRAHAAHEKLELTPGTDGAAAFRYWRDLCGQDYGAIRRGADDDHAAMIDQAFRGLKGRAVLDVGCAMGGVVRGLAQRGAIAFGVDVLAWGIEHCPYPEIRDRLRQADARNLACVQSGVFDVVHANQVLEHIPSEDLPQVFSELCRVLKPGGILIGTVPGRETEGEVTHLTFEEECTWQEWLTGAGLDVTAPALGEIRARLLAHARWHGCNTLLLAQRPTSPWVATGTAQERHSSPTGEDGKEDRPGRPPGA